MNACFPCLQIHDLAWSRDGQAIVTASADFTARIWPAGDLSRTANGHLRQHQVSIWPCCRFPISIADMPCREQIVVPRARSHHFTPLKSFTTQFPEAHLAQFQACHHDGALHREGQVFPLHPTQVFHYSVHPSPSGAGSGLSHDAAVHRAKRRHCIAYPLSRSQLSPPKPSDPSLSP